MVDMYQLLIKRYSPAGDGEPYEEWTVDSITDSNLERMVKRWQDYKSKNALRKRAGDILFMSVQDLSTVRMLYFKVFV